jgi:hypothetical protein
MTTEREYQYDPTLKLADMAKAEGLERLRWIPDRGLAGFLVTLWEAAHDPKRIAQCDRFDQARRRERKDQLVLVATSAQRGDFGGQAQDLANHFFDRDIAYADMIRLEEFLKALQRLNIDVHSMPSRTHGGKKRFGE